MNIDPCSNVLPASQEVKVEASVPQNDVHVSQEVSNPLSHSSQKPLERSGSSDSTSSSPSSSPHGMKKRRGKSEAQLHWQPQGTKLVTDKLQEEWNKEVDIARREHNNSWLSFKRIVFIVLLAFMIWYWLSKIKK